MAVAPTDYPAYDVKLSGLVYRTLVCVRLWGKWVWLDTWTRYDGDELRARHRRWSLKLAVALERKRYQICGVLADGTQVPLAKVSPEGSREVGERQASVGEFPEIAGASETNVAYHLRDCCKLTYDAVVTVMGRAKFKQITGANVARKRGYGADSARKLGSCPICGRKRRKAEA